MGDSPNKITYKEWECCIICNNLILYLLRTTTKGIEAFGHVPNLYIDK